MCYRNHFMFYHGFFWFVNHDWIFSLKSRVFFLLDRSCHIFFFSFHSIYFLVFSLTFIYFFFNLYSYLFSFPFPNNGILLFQVFYDGFFSHNSFFFRFLLAILFWINSDLPLFSNPMPNIFLNLSKHHSIWLWY